MPSKYSERLKEIAMEEDSDKRLELSASLDSDVEELDERFDNRDDYNAAIAERDAAIAERDDWKKRYSDRFFDAGEGDDTDPKRVNARYVKEVQEESKPLGFAALWQ